VEFRRQNRLIATTWEHCFRRDIPMPRLHHLGVMEEFGEADNPLCDGALKMMQA
jgi:hypothetical protein